jgi:hypothetical protein
MTSASSDDADQYHLENGDNYRFDRHLILTTGVRQQHLPTENQMYNAKRDGVGEGANRAIPSMGAIEGRIVVLEVLASTSLHLLLKAGDKHQAHQTLALIRRAMRAKCEDIQLTDDDARSAIAYAQELMDATMADASFLKPVTIEDALLIA